MREHLVRIAVLLATLLAANIAAAGDMVSVPGGDSRIGVDRGRADETPSFQVRVDAFKLDRAPVTVAEFTAYAQRTQYATQAEQVGSSAVMTFGTGRWSLMPGATFRKPEGPKGPDAIADHPVTHVSWNDAANYCAAEGKRLPTEVEFEHATRLSAGADNSFAFGSELVQGGKYRANVWTGVFPVVNSAADGYRTTSPVGAFGAGPLGLTDMAGNVWEWTSDWYRPYAERNAPMTVTAASEKTQRGGSFLCDPKFCYGFRATARGHATPDSSHMHVGFRCARDLKGSA